MIDVAAQILTAIALVATIVAHRGMRQIKQRSAVASKLQSFYVLVAALLALRLLHSVWPTDIVVSFMMIVAAWLPFFLLRLAEELARRHATRLVKIMALAGALLFSFLALTLGLVWSTPAIIGLAAFQAIMLLCVLMMLWRDRCNVTQPEQQAMALFSFALMFAMPLVITDFQALFPDMPVRGGVFAIFLMLLATSRLVMGNGKPVLLVTDALLVLCSGAVATFALSILMPAVSDQTMLVTGATACAIIVLVILIERLALPEDNDMELLRSLAKLGPDTGRSGLLMAHPILAQGTLVDAAQVDDLPQATLESLAIQSVITAGSFAVDPVLADAARTILDRFSATHLLRLSAKPPQFIAVAAGGFSGTDMDDELMITARLLEAAK